jgi:anti-sigma regulatory factor (Ser/Thr protein kinase)
MLQGDGTRDCLHRTVRNDFREIPALCAAVEAFAASVGLSETRRLDLRLAIEEAAANVIRHAWDGGSHTFEVKLSRSGPAIVVEVEDDGRPFDPLGYPHFDVEAPLEERRCGGMGIHLIRELVDEMSYSRVGERNRLRLFLKRERTSEPHST